MWLTVSSSQCVEVGEELTVSSSQSVEVGEVLRVSSSQSKDCDLCCSVQLVDAVLFSPSV